MIERVFSHQDQIYFIHGDSTHPEWDTFLSSLPGGVDLVLMDPPFNIADKGKVTKTHGKIYSNREAWGGDFQDSFSAESYTRLLGNFLARAFAILNDGGSLVSFIDRRYAGIFAGLAEVCGFLYKNMVTFVKTNCVPKVRATNFGSATEVAVWLIKPNTGRTPSGGRVAKTKPRIFHNEKARRGCRTSDGQLDIQRYHNTHSSNVFFYTIGSKRTGHPCEKYVGQLEPLIRTLSTSVTENGGFVLDLCAGGFNSGLVAYEKNRRYVGFEIDQYYWSCGSSILNHMIQNPGIKIPRLLKIQPKAER